VSTGTVLDPSMSLVGRLEDLSVGEILQIVSLSKRSGMLRLESPKGKANLYIKVGKVIYSSRSDEREGVLGLLAHHGLVEVSRLEPVRELLENASDAGTFRQLLEEHLGIKPEALQNALRKRIEELVFSLFFWEEGTFSFQLVENEAEHPLLAKMMPLFLEDGIGAQFLVMEGARRKDELLRTGPGGPAEAGPGDLTGFEEDEFGIEEKLGVEVIGDSEDDKQVDAEIDAFEVPTSLPPVTEELADLVLFISSDDELSGGICEALTDKGIGVVSEIDVASSIGSLQEMRVSGTPIVVVDLMADGITDEVILGGLDFITTVWEFGFNLSIILFHRDPLPRKLKEKLSSITSVTTLEIAGMSVSTESVESSVEKIIAKVLSSLAEESERPPEPVDDISAGSDEIVIEVETELYPSGIQEEAVVDTHGTGSEPAADIEPGDDEEYYDIEQDFQDDLKDLDIPFAHLDNGSVQMPDAIQDPQMQRLSSFVAELRRPDISGEITLLALRFASGFASRAVLFLVRKNDIKGLGQFGVDLGEGKDADAAVRSLELPVGDDSVFFRVINSQQSYRGKLKDSPTEKKLSDELGGGKPGELFVGPIISMGKVAVILYCDDFPAGKGLESTETMDIFLSHAGLALDRAFLEMKLKAGGS